MDALGLGLIGGTALSLVGFGLIETVLHRRTLAGFRYRVHVNGTRGKSSVTRLIAAGLRAGGIRTCAKTTGTLPRLIRPDGTEEPVYRVGPANVIEQIGILRRARELDAEAVVIECMALQPFLQWVSTASLVRPTHGVVTNVRADHLDVMGPDEEAVGRALAGSVPLEAPLYTAESKHASALREATLDRGGTFVVVRPETEVAPISREQLARFRYIEHAENVELALRVCEDIGVARERALLGMQAAAPDPGALTIEYRLVDGQKLCFVNGFAANDPESTGQVWELALERAPHDVRRVALVNCRADRPDRSLQLGEAIVSWTPADHVVVTGTGTHFFTSAAEKAGLDPARMIAVGQEDASELVRRLLVLGGSGVVVVGLGNIGGLGLELIDVLKAHQEVQA